MIEPYGLWRAKRLVAIAESERQDDALRGGNFEGEFASPMARVVRREGSTLIVQHGAKVFDFSAERAKRRANN